MNSTACYLLKNPERYCSQYTNVPFYYSPKPTVLEGIPDTHLALAVPVLAYWSYSLFFHILDISGWKWLEKYRIHDSAEVQARNLVSRTHVVFAVIFQQVIQTVLGLLALSDERASAVSHIANVHAIALHLHRVLSLVVDERWLWAIIPDLAYFTYWWGIPAIQLLTAMFVIDTWQYFLHRLFHVNTFLYKQFHSWHHRLYVPYAFGALYNHPIEGFLLDSFGAFVAEVVTRLTTRQAMVLFVVSTFKTVDDHCGYNLPFDPLQLLTSNNADYHDIHHQVAGIKSNFAQPFFIHWDTIMGTRLTRQDLERRRKQLEEKVMKKE